MNRPDHHGPTEMEFLSDLQTRLLVSPSEAVARLQVGRAARTALVMRTRRRRHMWRTGLVALCISTLLSTSGVAVAGRLPGPVQVMVADAARLLPVPLPIPYPTVPVTTFPADPAAPGTPKTADASVQTSGALPAPTETVGTPDGDVVGVTRERLSGDNDDESRGRDDRNTDANRDRDMGDDRDFLEENGRSQRHDR